MDFTRQNSTFYRRNLPHIIRDDRPLFITFSTHDRWRLPPGARTIALRHALHDHETKIYVDVVVIMPDHAHVILTVSPNEPELNVDLSSVMKAMKGVSARRINELLCRTGHVWQDESFDHVIRDSERSRAKIEYVCANPVRAGLVSSPDEYPWLWRSWVEGHRRK